MKYCHQRKDDLKYTVELPQKSLDTASLNQPNHHKVAAYLTQTGGEVGQGAFYGCNLLS